MLALKLQSLTTRTLQRSSTPRLIRSSTISIRTFPLWRNPNTYNKPLPPKIYPVKAKSSPRIRPPSQKIPNGSFPSRNTETPEKEPGPIFIISVIVCIFIILPLVADIILRVLGAICRGLLRKLGLMAPAPAPEKEIKDAVERAMWVDWYAREGASPKEESDESKR